MEWNRFHYTSSDGIMPYTVLKLGGSAPWLSKLEGQNPLSPGPAYVNAGHMDNHLSLRQVLAAASTY